MSPRTLSRRDFIRTSAAFASLVAAGPAVAAAATKRTATDLVPLGKTGLKISRLGIGTGSNGGNVQRNLGQDEFNRLIRYAYDHGVTYIDTAQSYRTYDWIGAAIKGLPREKLFLQSKIGGTPENALELIDRARSIFNTDYIDSLLVHCTVTKNWTDERKRVMDAFLTAQDKQWIRARGVSVHSLPALELAAESDWNQVHLVRLNPQGSHMDTPAETWNAPSNESHVNPVVEQIKTMRARGRGVIGMKLIGEGDFAQPEEREKAIRFVMQSGLCDSVVIGFKNTAEIDEAIERINRALAA
jgi:predicted aldo/keto reductase-like oxidoreductase